MTKYLVHLEHFDGTETNLFDTYEKALAWYNEAKDYELTESYAEGFIDTDFKVYICEIIKFSEFLEDVSKPVYQKNDNSDEDDIETEEYYYTLQEIAHKRRK